MRAARLGLLDGDRERLTAWTRSSTVRAGLAQRARIVLLAADGVSHTEIADRLGWRSFEEGSERRLSPRSSASMCEQE